MPHQHYRLEDFIGDETFRHWVNRTDALHAASWDDWLREHPGQAALAEQAADIIRGLHFDKPPLDPAKTEEDWERLRASLPAAAPVRPLRPAWYRLAAAVALLLTALSGAWYLASRPVAYATAYGQKETVTLPDGSRVTLNAHSRLEVPRRWAGGQAREVWLEGEAFFAVTEKAAPGGPVKFVVHTRDLDVEVLGTEFNVKQRSAQTTVTLESGSIHLRPHDPRLAPLRLRPGEQAELDGGRLVPHRVADPARFSTWKQGQLVLDGKTLAEVAKVIEETYGRKVVLRGAGLAGLKLSGTYPLDNMDMLLRALALAAQVEVTYDDKQVIFGNRTD